MRTTFKVAELATMIYAILVFGSLCVEMAYFSTFGIAISSYLGVSEVLFSFLTKPFMYLPSLVVLVLPVFLPGLRLDSLSKTSFRERYAAFGWYSFVLIMVNIVAVLAVSMFYLLNYAAAIIVCLAGVLLLILPNSYMSMARDMARRFERIFKRSTRKFGAKNNKTEQPLISKTESMFRVKKYKRAKHYLQLVNVLCGNSLLYNVILSYSIMIIGLSAINYSRACAYIDRDIDPPTKMEVTVSSGTYVCDNDLYSYIGESVGFVFIYDRTAQETLVLPRGEILRSSYAVSERNLSVKRYFESLEEKQSKR
jgi:hypothetical protein